MSILEGLKWFSEKHSRERITFFYHSFSIFYSFFTLWTSKRHKKTAWNMVILFSSKRDSYEKCWICCKNAINVEKKFSTFSLVHGLLPNFFSGWYINITQRKPSGNLSYYWEILKKQYFHGKTWLASFKSKFCCCFLAQIVFFFKSKFCCCFLAQIVCCFFSN